MISSHASINANCARWRSDDSLVCEWVCKQADMQLSEEDRKARAKDMEGLDQARKQQAEEDVSRAAAMDLFR